jgi:WD40 repeat protein
MRARYSFWCSLEMMWRRVFPCLLSLLLAACSGIQGQAEPPGQVPESTEPGGKLTGEPELVVQLSHAKYISAMSVSADGRFLITAAWEERARLWDAHSGQEIRRFEGHTGTVTAAALSPEGRFLLTGSEDGTARLWDTATDTEVLQLAGHTGSVTAVALSRNGLLMVTGSDDMTVRVWSRDDGREILRIEDNPSEISSLVLSPDNQHVLVGSHASAKLRDLLSGEEVQRFEGHEGGVTSVAISPDGALVLTGSLDDTARLWQLDSGEEIRRFEGHTDGILSVAYSPDGRYILSGGKDRTARLWSARQGKQLLTYGGRHVGEVTRVEFSPDGRRVFTASEKIARAWDASSGVQVRSFEGNSALVSSVVFSPDGGRILTGSWDDHAYLWETASGTQVRALQGHAGDVRAVAFSPDGGLVLTGSRDGTAGIWDLAVDSGMSRIEGHSAGVRPVTFTRDGKHVLTGSDDRTARLWQAAKPFEEVKRFGPHPNLVSSSAISPDGHRVLTGSANEVRLWDAETARELRRFEGHEGFVNDVTFSPDGRFALSASWDKTAKVWDVETGRTVFTLNGHFDGVYAARFSPDGRYIVTGSEDNTARLWDMGNGRELRRFEGHASSIIAVSFSPDGRFVLTGSADQTARLWDTSTGEELCKLVSFRDGGWAVVDRDGRFDASNGGDVDGLHWVIGTEAVALNQLKERYYDPGLLAKKLGRNPQPLRDVEAFARPKLYPALEIAEIDPKRPEVHIKLKNRGGGIGRIIVSINGKEMVADARGPQFDPHAQALEIAIPIVDHPYLIAGENMVEVRAFNAEGYLSSRGAIQVYSRAGGVTKKPKLWAIVAGISDYEGDRIDLQYAAKDAQDVAKAIRLGGERLFGADNVDVSLLTSPGGNPPTKKRFEEAFRRIRSAASGDILVVYLAGHGAAAGGSYYYLTSEARSTSLDDPAVRDRVTVSSSEMVKWFKESPALKQVMVLDTCAAGAVAKVLMDQREISSDQIRAIDRLKDRTGLHVLMGSAANAVSYETSEFQQGLLTHALLRGIKGAALHEDEFIEVSPLFQYVADEVPRLAAHIGGIQRPRIATPREAESFSIGQLKEQDRAAIPLTGRRPMLLQPMLVNALELIDDLNLSASVRKLLRERSYAATRSGREPMPVVYLDSDQFPGAYRPSGTYAVSGDTLTLRMALGRAADRVATFEIRGSRRNLDSLTTRVVDAILEEMGGYE